MAMIVKIVRSERGALDRSPQAGVLPWWGVLSRLRSRDTGRSDRRERILFTGRRLADSGIWR